MARFETPPITVGGVPVTPFSEVQAAAEELLSRATDGIGAFALAINAEKIVRIRSEPGWAPVLDAATVCYADGAPIAWTLRQRGAPDAKRIPGVELWEAVMRLAGPSNVPVYLVGGRASVLEGVRSRLQGELGVRVVGTRDGYFQDQAEVIRDIVDSGAKIVTVAMGTPAQEHFIMEALQHHSSALYMGVGGTYDVYIGAVPRAPVWFRERGMEWCYRLLRQPTRIRRQINLIRYALLQLGGQI